MRSKRLLRWVATLTVMFLVAAACGGDDDGEGADAADGDEGDDGAPSEVVGFDGETIDLGVITPQTGRVAIIGNPLTKGNQVFFDALNEEEGGIAGQYPVELTVADSQYDAPTAVQAYDRLKNEVLLFTQLLGTPIVNALLEQLEEDGIVAQPASLDSFWVREPNLVAAGAPYQIQAINAMQWVDDGMPTDDGGGDEAALGRVQLERGQVADETVCFAGHDDPYGDAGFEGLSFAAEQMGFDIAAEVRFSSSDEDAAAHGPNVGQLSDAGCTVVFVTALAPTLGALLGASAQAQYAPTWIGQSPNWVNALAASAVGPYMAENFYLVAEGPEWGDTSVEGMARMMEDIEQYAPDQNPDLYFTFGYAAAWMVAQVLEQAVASSEDPDDPDLSRSAIIEAMESLDVVSTGGLLGDYQYGPAEERVPPRGSRIFAVTPGEDNPLDAVTGNIESPVAEQFEF